MFWLFSGEPFPFRSRAALCKESIAVLVSIALCSTAAYGQRSIDDLKDFRINGLVRFHDAQSAEATRHRLIHAIWPGGLPQTRPEVTAVENDAEELASIDRSLFVSAQRYDINVSGFDWISHVFVVHPRSGSEQPAKLAVVHAGHMPEGAAHYLEAGLSDAASQLLRDGFVVALVQVPLAGWNHDADGAIDGTPFRVSRRLTGGHDELFARVEPTLGAGTMRFFLEPVVQTINELTAQFPDHGVVLMIGLSGGGWATHLAAAVETRIDVSIPVAGALPLYARPFSPGSRGDAEQEYAPIFGEEDSDQDGIPDRATEMASWLEVFALGGISPHPGRTRRQIQVLNLYDSCCFNGEVYKTYGEPLQKLTATINRGQWSVHIDDSHRDHLISQDVITNVLRLHSSR